MRSQVLCFIDYQNCLFIFTVARDQKLIDPVCVGLDAVVGIRVADIQFIADGFQSFYLTPLRVESPCAI